MDMSTRVASSTCTEIPRVRGLRGHKERSKNFTELEKRTVLELIAQHRDVLRQGRSNNATNKNKQLVWSTICAEVNKRCNSDRPRTPAQVKMWYENYKKKCKMRAIDPQSSASGFVGAGSGTVKHEGSSLLDGLLWQSVHPFDVKDSEERAPSASTGSLKDEDCPLNMSSGRLSSCGAEDISQHVLEPHIQIIQNSPTLSKKSILSNMGQELRVKPFAHESDSNNIPLNLSNLDSDSERRHSSDGETRRVPQHEGPYHKPQVGDYTCEEERLYFMAKRQHAIWEHEAKMKILNMELRQKDEIFSLQKQLFLIELKLKMDFLEKACGNSS